jgi:signal transduction histidine kinase
MVARLAGSLRSKLIGVILATTLIALLSTAGALVVFDAADYRRSLIEDLTAQADILARASAPALAFDDPRTARENLELLRARPGIIAAAIYAPSGALFASYLAAGAREPLPQLMATQQGYRFEDREIVMQRPVVENNRVTGTVVLRARYDLGARLATYLRIVGGSLVASLLIALAVASRLQSTITRPILQLTGAARRVMADRDYSLRVDRASDDEVGYLVDAFNDMLAEVGRSTDALHAADRRKDEFLATLAHELRNPLSPLRSGLKVLDDRRTDPERARLARDMMRRQLRQMVRLIDDLLDVSRISTGKLVVERAPTDLKALIDSAVESVRPVVDLLGHHLEVDLPAEPVSLYVDPTRIAQVVANLLNNAAKYTESGGTIRVRCRIEDAQAVIEVSDNGIGIDPAMQARIFDMFAQADVPHGRLQAGLGVGLSLARTLVELHGGSLDARSEGINRGATFTVRLPLTAAVPAAGAGPIASQTPADGLPARAPAAAPARAATPRAPGAGSGRYDGLDTENTSR